MLREFSLADLITLANGFAGMASVLCVLHFLVGADRNMLWLAFACLPVAMVADYFDGTVARWRRRSSPLGAQLDSLADLVSFGVAPAVIGFGVGLRGGVDAVILIYFVACGISRLARYNVTAASLSDDTGKVRYYEGTPIPTSLLLVVVMAILLWRDRVFDALPGGMITVAGYEWHPLSLMFFVSGSAMISKTLRIPKP